MSGPASHRIAAVAGDIDRRRGARLRAVHQDGPLRFRLVLEGKSDRIDVVLDLDPEYPRVHLAPHQHAPGAPTPLASRMRRYLVGARLDGARAVPGERAIVLAFLRGGGRIHVWFEGFGRGANFYVVGPDGCVAVTPRGQVARRRGASVGEAFTPVSRRTTPPPPEQTEAESRSKALEARRRQRARSLERDLERARRRVARWEATVASEGEAEAAKLRGEEMLASFDQYGPERVDAIFREARRLRRAAEEARRLLPEARDEIERLQHALSELEDATEVELPPAAPKSREAQRAQPWRTFVSSDGWRILVGRDARGNDRLTVEAAKPQDLFLHVLGAHGSHVIVPTPRGKTVPRDTLLDAAELACFFSEKRGASLCEVNYTPRRYVRKKRGAPAGQVQVERAKTLALRPDEPRRQRLLASRRK